MRLGKGGEKAKRTSKRWEGWGELKGKRLKKRRGRGGRGEGRKLGEVRV